MPKKENTIYGKGRLPLHLLNAEQPDQDAAFRLDAPHLDLGDVDGDHSRSFVG